MSPSARLKKETYLFSEKLCFIVIYLFSRMMDKVHTFSDSEYTGSVCYLIRYLCRLRIGNYFITYPFENVCSNNYCEENL
jgi:hypothetical protein